jgi:hypothetical protein
MGASPGHILPRVASAKRGEGDPTRSVVEGARLERLALWYAA